jgi:hypothetical protein
LTKSRERASKVRDSERALARARKTADERRRTKDDRIQTPDAIFFAVAPPKHLARPFPLARPPTQQLFTASPQDPRATIHLALASTLARELLQTLTASTSLAENLLQALAPSTSLAENLRQALAPSTSLAGNLLQAIAACSLLAI